DDTVAYAKELGLRGIDLIDCSSGGLYGSATTARVKRSWGFQVPYAERVRREAGIMSMAVGLIIDPHFAESILQKGQADLIAIARGWLDTGDKPRYDRREHSPGAIAVVQGKERRPMKLMMFGKGKGTALGLVDGKSVIDLSVAGASLPKDLKSLIAAPPSAMAAIKTAISTAQASARLALDAVKPALPISPSGKIICVGLNYALHAKEGGHAIPTYPSFFLRVPTSLVAAGAPV